MEMKLPGFLSLVHMCRKTADRALVVPLTCARACIEFLLGLLADFFAEDPCLLCMGSCIHPGSPVDCSGEGGGEGLDPTPLTEPVTVAVCGLRFKNHPVCISCARDFETARTAGVLGRIDPGGSVLTVAGDVFVADSEALGNADEFSAGRMRAIRVIAPYMTNDNVLQIVHLAKYRGIVSLTELMARAIARAIDRFGVECPAPAVLAPVPLFAGEQRRLDHTSRISESLALALSLPVASGKLRKIRLTGSQSRMQRHNRAQNVRNAFSADGFGDYHVFLVDDVVTSGATAGACSAALAAAGAQSITILCFGRAL